MKKIIIISLFIFFLFMFLVYSGIFRNNTNPLDVAKYYFECLRNGEWFLTYQIYDHKYFDSTKLYGFYKKNRMNSIRRINLDLIKINGNNAYVRAKMIYKNKQVAYSVLELERAGIIWLIKSLKDEKVD